MDDDSRLITQMAMIKAVNPAIKVLGYRNSIQAYNWMSIVREKLDDPQYADWFLQYRDGIDGATKNSSKYGSIGERAISERTVGMANILKEAPPT